MNRHGFTVEDRAKRGPIHLPVVCVLLRRERPVRGRPRGAPGRLRQRVCGDVRQSAVGVWTRVTQNAPWRPHNKGFCLSEQPNDLQGWGT